MRIVAVLEADNPDQVRLVLNQLVETGVELTTRIATEPEELHLQGALVVEQVN